MENNNRSLGTVQWFSRVKGYGFVRPDGQEEDVFVHYSSINGEGYRNLDEGQRVEFTMEDTPKGPQAVDVARTDKVAEPADDTVEFDVEEVQAADDTVEFDVEEVQSAENTVEFDVEEVQAAEAFL